MVTFQPVARSALVTGDSGMKLRFLLTACLLAIGLTLATSCKDESGTSASGNEIVIGEFASLTGSTATFGQSSHEGTMLAVDQINASGGVLGKKLKIISED